MPSRTTPNTIAEDLLLLLLDNASGQPGVDGGQVQRLLAAAVLLDIAYDCRVRPAAPHEPLPAGTLVALAGPPSMHPVLRPALELLQRAPLSPAKAIAKLSKRTQDDVTDQLLRSGQIHQVQLATARFQRKNYAWPLTDRLWAEQARSAVLAALFDRERPNPATASIIALLHSAGALGALLSLNDRGWEWVHYRAGEITSGSWVNEANTAEVNLAMTIAVIRPALT